MGIFKFKLRGIRAYIVDGASRQEKEDKSGDRSIMKAAAVDKTKEDTAGLYVLSFSRADTRLSGLGFLKTCPLVCLH